MWKETPPGDHVLFIQEGFSVLEIEEFYEIALTIDA